MKFLKQRARLSSLTLLLTISVGGLSACVSAPPVFQNANPCSELIPEGWYTTGVASASLPTDATAGAWVAFGVAQTGQLDKANAQAKDAVEIIRKCEARDKAAFESLQPKSWFQFW